MKKILYVRGNYPVNPRTQKMKEVLVQKHDIKFVFWDRRQKGCYDNQDEHLYKSNIIINTKWKKIISIFGFYKYIKKMIKEYNPDIIYAYHWDMFLLVQLLLKRKKTPVIYDVSDMPDCSGVMFHLIKIIEELFIRNNVYVILASKYFIPFYSNKNNNDIVVIDNKPPRPKYHIKPFNFQGKYNYNIIYVGNIKYKKILVNLVNVVKNMPVNLLFFGGGLDEDYMKNYCKDLKNVYFFGQYSMQDINSFYKIGDLAWAAYPSKSINVKHATSNKYFESLINKVPCVFAEDSELGKEVAQKELGFSVNPYDERAIKETLFKAMDVGLLAQIKYNLCELNDEELYWDNETKKMKELLKKVNENIANN